VPRSMHYGRVCPHSCTAGRGVQGAGGTANEHGVRFWVGCPCKVVLKMRLYYDDPWPLGQRNAVHWWKHARAPSFPSARLGQMYTVAVHKMEFGCQAHLAAIGWAKVFCNILGCIAFWRIYL